MPDKKRFYDDPGLTRLETRIVAAGSLERGAWVRLEETLFYPEGGGQPSDRGRIGEAQVVDVVTRGDEVLHFVDRPMEAGLVMLELDEVRRFDHCQQHTAQHLVTAVLVDRHGMPTTSFHLGTDYTSIEVKGAVPSQTALRSYEAEVNAHVREDRKVTSRWVAPEDLPSSNVRSRGLPEGHAGPVRLVEIEGLDLNTCGGTHVQSLAEIQAITIVNAEPARGGTRIRFLAGGRILADLERRRELEVALKERIGTAPEEFATVIDGWSAARKWLERRVGVLESELAEALALALAAQPGPVLCAVRPGAGPEALRALASALLERRPEAIVALAGGGGDAGEACFLVQSGTSGPGDVAELGARVRDLMQAKGGGKGRSFQGKGGARPDLDALRRAAGARS